MSILPTPLWHANLKGDQAGRSWKSLPVQYPIHVAAFRAITSILLCSAIIVAISTDRKLSSPLFVTDLSVGIFGMGSAIMAFFYLFTSRQSYSRHQNMFLNGVHISIQGMECVLLFLADIITSSEGSLVFHVAMFAEFVLASWTLMWMVSINEYSAEVAAKKE